MTRSTHFALMLVALALAMTAIAAVNEHRAPNAGLPLATIAAPKAPVLFVPCPLAPRNFRKPERRIA